MIKLILIFNSSKELSGLFQDQTECLRNLAKDDILMDLKEDRTNITKVIIVSFSNVTFTAN